MLKKESEILYCFAVRPWESFTFTELKKASKKKSRSYLEGVLKKFVKEGILKKDSVGRLPIYSLNIASAKARVYAGFVLEHSGWNRKNIPYVDLQKIIDKIPYENYIFIITGSYSKGTETKKSDIDIIIIVEDSSEPKKVYAELAHACELNIPKIHLYVFRNSEFIKMLSNKEANYGKEIVKNFLVLSGGQVFMKLIKEAVENGFNGKYLS